MKFQNRGSEVKVMEDHDLQGAYRQAEGGGGCSLLAVCYSEIYLGFTVVYHGFTAEYEGHTAEYKGHTV